MRKSEEETKNQLLTAVRALQRIRLETKREDGATVEELTNSIDLVDFVAYRALQRLEDSLDLEIQQTGIKL